jgi:hypothetical protein
MTRREIWAAAPYLGVISENHHLAYDGPGLWSFWELIIGVI